MINTMELNTNAGTLHIITDFFQYCGEFNRYTNDNCLYFLFSIAEDDMSAILTNEIVKYYIKAEKNNSSKENVWSDELIVDNNIKFFYVRLYEHKPIEYILNLGFKDAVNNDLAGECKFNVVLLQESQDKIKNMIRDLLLTMIDDGKGWFSVNVKKIKGS